MKSLEFGEIVIIKKWGVIEHWGVVGFGGEVISASQEAGFVIKQTGEEFCEGNWGDIYSKGFLGQLSAHEVVTRAYSQIGKPYCLFTFNCQHFANYCHGLEGSPQLRMVFTTVIMVVAGVILTREKVV